MEVNRSGVDELDRILRILGSIKENAGAEVHSRIINTCGMPDGKQTPLKQAKYVKSVLAELENSCGSGIVADVLRPCGRQCISDGTIEKARSCCRKAANLDEFLRNLNESHIGGGHLRMEDGKIIGVYDRCYCGLPKRVKGMPPLYCNCSAGWYERLFSETLGKPVEVRKIQTILEGSDQCVFEIIVGK